ncbi:alpha/beta fold hydrolase [Actinomadura rubrisoli]|uniref:Alpha/beta hydrolase n=1 Tax=Actinomadura rubrisoli TaxID=2530368 RepID=A0A4V2YXT8_9ACTN|nr:alpha/beta hydrolase [Actinomadura rubrisoli]TDD90387.1 alpha/beta hydrolase [Actinomadura rubrisoli]
MRIDQHVMVSADGARRVPCEVGTLEVPEIRGGDASRTVALAFARFRGTGPEPGPPMVFLEGGPGGSGLATWPKAPGRYLPFLEFGDVVVFDQRGVGRSRPRLDGPFRLDLPLDRAVGREEYLKELLAKAADTARFWRDRGVDLRGYTSVESADDVADLMTALGYETFRTFGGSYGSHLSLAVIRRHGDRIDRSLLQAVEGPDDTYKLPGNTDRHLARLAALAASAPELDGRVPDLLGLMGRVFERLRERPATADGVVIGEFDVKAITADWAGSPEFLRRLPALYLAAAEQDRWGFWAEQTRLRRTDAVPGLMSMSMDCASGATPARLKRIAEEAETALLEDYMNFPFPFLCPVIGAPDAGDGYRASVRSDVPALFACGTLDGRTPPANARAVADGFTRGHFVLVRNAAHQSMFERPELFPAVRDFLHGRPVALTGAVFDFEFEPHRPDLVGSRDERGVDI